MPEPGVNDHNFSRPTTKSPRGPVGNRPGGRRLRKPLRIPGEYAEFRLEDGQFLIDVLGPDFFEPDSGQVTEKQREGLRVGNDAMARHRRDNPDRFAAPPAVPGMPAGENGAQFASLPFGPEEAEPEDSGQGFPVAKPRPARIGAEEPDSLRGFRMFELPPTVDGSVDKGALVPGADSSSRCRISMACLRNARSGGSRRNGVIRQVLYQGQRNFSVKVRWPDYRKLTSTV